MSVSLREQLAQKEREVAAVIAINRIISQEMPLPAMLDLVSAEIASLLNAPFCAILIRNPQNKLLYINGSFGLSADYIAAINQQSDQYGWIAQLPSDQALRLAQPIVWEDARIAPEFASFQDAVQSQGYVTMSAAPLVAGDQHIGTINCYYTNRYSFSDAELSLLMTLASHTATVIRNKQLLDLLLQSEAIHRQLTRLVLEEDGLSAVVTTTAELLIRPVALYDARLRLIAGSNEHFASTIEAKLGKNMPTRLQLADTAMLLTPLAARQRRLGYLVVVEQPPLSAEIDHRALEHAATVCTLELVKQRVALDTDRRMRGDFVDDMLLGRFTDSAELKRRAAHFDFRFSGSFRVLIADIDQFGTYIEQHNLNETQVEEIKLTLANLIEQCCHEIKKAAFIAPQGDRAVVLWPMRSPHTLSRIEQMATRLSEQVTLLLPDLAVTIAVSTPVTDVLDFARGHHECLDALAIGKRFGRFNSLTTDCKASLIIFDNLGIYALLLRSSAIDELQRFAQRTLAPVLSHDRAEELLHTLTTALRYQFSPTKTANALFVHPNTVKYRLRQLRSLLDRDFNDAQQALELQLALVVHSLTPPDHLY